jgi:sugar O-acyltransferase (sialic acid O-acetyltransferase NeuD family)
MRVLVIGAGGHGQVIADAIQSARRAGGQFELIGFLDDSRALHGKKFLGADVLGPVTSVADIPHDAIVVAIGDNRTRRDVYCGLKASGEYLITVRHPNSTVAEGVEIGSGSMICAGVVVNTGSVIGENVILNTGCTVDHHNTIGGHVHLAPGVHTGGEVIVGEGTLVGIGASVLPRCHIGSWSTVGGGAVVIRNLPDSVTAIGVPATVVQSRQPGRS